MNIETVPLLSIAIGVCGLYSFFRETAPFFTALAIFCSVDVSLISGINNSVCTAISLPFVVFTPVWIKVTGPRYNFTPFALYSLPETPCLKLNFDLSSVDSSLLDWYKNLDFYELGKTVASKINTALSNIDWTEIQSGAKTIAQNIGNFINGYVDGFDWDLLGTISISK